MLKIWFALNRYNYRGTQVEFNRFSQKWSSVLEIGM
jgi:hypothetical protein